MKISINTKYEGKKEYITKKESFHSFDIIFKAKGKSEKYNYLTQKENEVEVKDNKLCLNEYGAESALLCFASDTLYNHKDGESYSLGATRQDWEWIEDVIIRKRMKSFKKLYTNV